MKSMSRQFYATRQGLLPGLRALESERRLQYVLEEMAPEPTPVIFRSAFEIPGLGVAEYGDYSGEHTFLVDEWGTRITMGETPQTKGGVLYEVSLATNPTAFAFQPAGRFGDRTLILGSVGTATGDPKSLAHVQVVLAGAEEGLHQGSVVLRGAGGVPAAAAGLAPYHGDPMSAGIRPPHLTRRPRSRPTRWEGVGSRTNRLPTPSLVRPDLRDAGGRR